MKKLMLLFIGIGATVLVNAQHVSVGPTAGFGHSWISGDNSDNGRFHPSYNVGAKLVYSIMEHWGVSGDIKFSSEGQSVGKDNDNKSVVRANYIRVPIQGIYFFGDFGDAIRPKVSIGPSFGFLVGGENKVYVNGDKTVSSEVKDNLSGFDFGLTGAVGLNFRIRSGVWLNTDVAYYHGLTDIAKNSSTDLKNKNLGFNVGVAFGIGGK